MSNLSRGRREVVRLPPLSKSLDKLSSFDLKELISELLSRNFTNGTYLGKAILKPLWWPRRAPWPYKLAFTRKETMQQVVEACYSFYDQEKLLKGPLAVDESRSTRTLAREASTRQSSTSRSSGGSGGRVAQTIKVVNNIDGSLSYVADNVLATKENQENAPQYPRRMSPAYEATLAEEKADVPNHRANGDSPTIATTAVNVGGDCAFVEIFICFFCEHEFSVRSELQSHQKDCKHRPPELQMMGVTPHRTRRQLYPPAAATQTASSSSMARSAKIEKPRLLDKSDFASALGLVTKTKAVSLKKEKAAADKDIEIIEVDESVPQTPTTPRTPKSLISQLSRDASPPPFVNKNLSLGVVKIEKDSDNESEASEKEEEGRAPRTQKLFSIDLCSVLGQRVKRHFDRLTEKPSSDDNREKHRNYEAFCHTPKKTNVREKLRDRNVLGYPISFRKRAPKYTHIYCFTRPQRKERLLELRTGLTCRARALKRLVRNCSVQLRRMSPGEIKKWTSRKPRLFGFNTTHHPSQQIPHSPVYMSNSDLERLLRLKMPDGKTQAFQVRMPHTTTVVPISPTSSPISSVSPTLVGPLVITPNRPRPLSPRPGSSVLHSLLTGQTPPAFSPQKARQGVSPGWPHPAHLTPRPGTGGRSQRDDDVISISSDESSGYERKSKKRAASPSESEGSHKRRRVDEEDGASKPVALLFRCHLCNAALTCKQNARQVIQSHFANLHKVFNIDLIEHVDASGNKVMSIVEVATPTSSSPGGGSGSGSGGLSEDNKSSPAPTTPPVNQGNSLWQKSGPVVDLTEDDVEEIKRGVTSAAVKPASLAPKPSQNASVASDKMATKQPQQTGSRSSLSGVKPVVSSSPGKAEGRSSQNQASPKSRPVTNGSPSTSSSPVTRAARKLFQDTESSARRSRRLASGGSDSVNHTASTK